MKSSNLPFTILLIALLCCTAVGVASADSTVPWLTGSFQLEYIDIGGSQAWIDFTDFPDANPWGLVTYPGVAFSVLLADPCFTQQPPCNSETSGNFAGNLISISIHESIDDYLMSGTVTDGYYSTYVHTYENGAIWGLYEGFNFDAQWNDGWNSRGGASVWWDYSLDLEQLGGALSMDTSAPEPGSMALLGSSIVGVAIILRRKLML